MPVMPASGIGLTADAFQSWIPAFAGMTTESARQGGYVVVPTRIE